MALSTQQITGLEAAYKRQQSGSANPADIKNLQYAQGKNLWKPATSQAVRIPGMFNKQSTETSLRARLRQQQAFTEIKPVGTPGTPGSYLSGVPTQQAGTAVLSALQNKLMASIPSEASALAPASAPPSLLNAGVTQGTTPTPTALEALQKAYLESEQERIKGLSASPTEISLQEQLNKQFGATETGVEEIEAKPILSELLWGQKERLLKQAGIATGGLQRQLALEQAKRTGLQEQQLASQGLMGQQIGWEMSAEQQRLADKRAKMAPTTIGNQMVQFNPATGKYETVYTAQEKAGAPMQVSPGNTIIDPNTGKVIYQAPYETSAKDTADLQKKYLEIQKLQDDIKNSTSDIDRQIKQADLQKKLKELSGDQPEISPYQAERVVRNLQSADELMKKAQANPGIFGRSAAAPIPDFMRSDIFRNYKFELDTLKANIAFGELTAMREASKTGGALGQVSDKEGQLLQAALGALSMSQSPENIQLQLQKIKDSINRWVSTVNQHSGKAVTREQLRREFPRATPQEIEALFQEESGFKQVGGDTNKATGMRTDRHNNPTALMWTSGVENFFKKMGHNVSKGDKFPDGNNYTLNMSKLSDPVKATIDYINQYGFYYAGNQRWSHTAMNKGNWNKLSYTQKKQLIKSMYQKEGNKGLLNNYFI